MKPKTLTTIVASVVIAAAPLINGCQSKNVPVYGPADPNGYREIIGHYRSTHFSTDGIGVGYGLEKEKKVYDANSKE